MSFFVLFSLYPKARSLPEAGSPMAAIHRALTQFVLHNVQICYQVVDPTTPILPLVPVNDVNGDFRFDGILSELF